MKSTYAVLFSILAATSSSVIAYENCLEYKRKNDITGYNACESRNRSEIRNSVEREEQREQQKRRDEEDRWRRDSAERNEQQFREKQLELQRRQVENQRQQLETQKRNTQKLTCDDSAAFKGIHDLVKSFHGPVDKLFRRHLARGDCAAATELVEAVLSSSALELISNAKATGRQMDADEAIKSVFTTSMSEFVEKCEKFQSKAEAKRPAAKLERLEAKQAPKAIAASKLFKDCPECPEMVVVPAGSFEMGREKSGASDERPVHRVTIQNFALGKTQVTRAQWKAIMGSSPEGFAKCGGDGCPVTISWNDTKEFIRQLNTKTGKIYRLPSEAEWEYACRAGEGADSYCGIDSAVIISNSSKAYTTAGRGETNAWSLYDMSGSVYEWVEDCWNANYNGAPTDGSAWISGNCAERRMRGGPFAPAARRNASVTTNKSAGLRLARMLP